MDTKPSEGPWTVQERLSGSENHRGFLIRDVNGFIVAEVYPRDGDGDEGRANAQRIAATLDLLGAAKLVLEWYEAENDHSKADFYQRLGMCRESEAAVRAAIARATGAA